ncbi:LamG-like jellyroll fold domain-containing protein [Asanoa siamensis]|uniref:LamG-like jellyroll fold domain-containing protein n=1 Tax=Asanoa siamensis TaxID=926357 RepID=A0ABQ4CVC5_9ACTN|nr:LamG-like jellyroll fold domain-containing protein [Asanoa siamensis]GIF75234.1 hypothetical protein Asi02nite_47520 [Asanoa siamensis]
MGVRGGRKLAAQLTAVVVLATGVGLASQQAGSTVPPAQAQPPAVLVTESDTLKQTEADAVEAAKSGGRAVEVGAYRGERRDVWAEPNGSFTEYTHQQAVRVVKNKRWVAPDASLERHPDGTVTPRAATYGLRLSGGGSGPFLTAERAGKSMSFTWPDGPLPAPVLDGDTATYAEIEPGLDLVVHAGTESFSHVLVVKDAAAARRASVANLALGLRTNGLSVDDAGGGRLVAVAAGGGRIFEAAEPHMWDAGDGTTEEDLTQAGAAARALGGTSRVRTPAKGAEPSRAAPITARKAALKVRVTDDTLHLTPDAALLADPKTRYPVYIDPIWSSTTNSYWAMVDSGYPNENYPKFDNKSDERAGWCQPDPNCNNSDIKRLMYALPSNYSGKTIIKAEFQVSLVRGWNNTARNVRLYMMGGGISSSTTWNNMPSWATHITTRSLGAEQGCGSSTRNSVFDVTSVFNGTGENSRATTTFGIRMETENNNQHFKRFCNNALLRVNWNRAPAKPAAGDLTSSPGGACVNGTGRPYVDTLPRLSAVLRDPDHLSGGAAENVRGEFRVRWTPTGGTPQTVTWTSGYKASGSRLDYTVPGTIPQNVVVQWDVRASDGTAWGPWSSESGGKLCEFMYDATTPTPPLVSSAEFLEPHLINCATYSDATWRDGVGVQSTFTFDSAASDVVEYRYGINTNPSPTNVLRPAVDGGPVTMRFVAQEEGVTFITVEARDRANKSSAIANCSFRVSPGAVPVAEWHLADEDDATEAADERGGAPATRHGAENVTFGVPGPGGPSDRAVRLGGQDGAYLATTAGGVVDTTKNFAISAWAKLDELGRDQTVLSQDGAGEPGFALGYDAGNNKWELKLPTTDVESLGDWTVHGGTPQAGVWTHLVAVFDASAGTVALSVNGVRTQAERRSRWNSHGPVQIGRRLEQGRYSGYFKGDIADVSIFNRLVVPVEGGPISEVKATRVGYWPVNAATGGSSPATGGGQALTLGGGAQIALDDPIGDPPVFPMLGLGELRLDGVDDYAATATAPAPTDHSFSVVARVRVASPDGGQPAAAVLSQPGTQQSAFVVRRNADNRWSLAMTTADTAGAQEVTAYDSQIDISNDLFGQLLALTYNAFTNEVRLYVDGQLAATARATHTAAWNATGGLQVGRAFVDGSWQEYFDGAVDEVRAYSGALDATTIQQLNLPIEKETL